MTLHYHKLLTFIIGQKTLIIPKNNFPFVSHCEKLRHSFYVKELLKSNPGMVRKESGQLSIQS